MFILLHKNASGMKLELKHLAVYLPYELKFVDIRNDKILTLVEINTANDTMGLMSAETNYVFFSKYDTIHFKPLLNKIPLEVPGTFSELPYSVIDGFVKLHYDIYSLLITGKAIEKTYFIK